MLKKLTEAFMALFGYVQTPRDTTPETEPIPTNSSQNDREKDEAIARLKIRITALDDQNKIYKTNNALLYEHLIRERTNYQTLALTLKEEEKNHRHYRIDTEAEVREALNALELKNVILQQESKNLHSTIKTLSAEKNSLNTEFNQLKKETEARIEKLTHDNKALKANKKTLSKKFKHAERKAHKTTQQLTYEIAEFQDLIKKEQASRPEPQSQYPIHLETNDTPLFIPAFIIKLLTLIMAEHNDQGLPFEAAVCGGWLRDRLLEIAQKRPLLSIHSRDLDLITNCPPDRLKEIFKAFSPHPIKNTPEHPNSFKYLKQSDNSQVFYPETAAPFDYSFDLCSNIAFSLEEQALRANALTRDVTINTFYWTLNQPILSPLFAFKHLHLDKLVTVGSLPERLPHEPRLLARLLRLPEQIEKTLTPEDAKEVHHYLKQVTQQPYQYYQALIRTLFCRGLSSKILSALNLETLITLFPVVNDPLIIQHLQTGATLFNYLLTLLKKTFDHDDRSFSDFIALILLPVAYHFLELSLKNQALPLHEAALDHACTHALNQFYSTYHNQHEFTDAHKNTALFKNEFNCLTGKLKGILNDFLTTLKPQPQSPARALQQFGLNAHAPEFSPTSSPRYALENREKKSQQPAQSRT